MGETCSPVFATTRWSVVLAAGDGGSGPGSAALEELCRTYWYPLYAYVRRRGHDAHSAQDLTQGFFERLLGRNDLAGLTREGGRFRSFLLTALHRYLIHEHERSQAGKRGGGRPAISFDEIGAEERYLREPAHHETPDRIFEREWAVALMERSLARLEREQHRAGRGDGFTALRPFLSREPEPGEYAGEAARLGIAPGALAVQVHRLRDRYRETVRATVAETVDGPIEVEAEMRHLLAVMRGD